MNKNLPIGLEKYLHWMPELGYGWHPADPISYEESYWDEYLKRDASEMGALLTKARVNFAREHWNGQIVDIGIGGGRFVRDADCFGFDVNQAAIEWLKSHQRFIDPYAAKVEAITCWDALEHIPQPEALIHQVKKWVFVSIPIFPNGEAVLGSRHYKPGEHIWYFTHEGLINWFEDLGFFLVKYNTIETDLGREGITTYAFRRGDAI